MIYIQNVLVPVTSNVMLSIVNMVGTTCKIKADIHNAHQYCLFLFFNIGKYNIVICQMFSRTSYDLATRAQNCFRAGSNNPINEFDIRIETFKIYCGSVLMSI